MIDLAVLAEELEFDLEDVKELLEMFILSSEGSLQNIKDALISCNLAVMKNEAHAIKGSAGNLRLDDIGKLANIIEEAAKNDLKADYTLIISKIDEKLQELKEV